MQIIFNWIHALFQSVPEIALFLSLALGYLVGKVRFGKFQLGGVAGSLLMAVLVSQSGVHVDDTVKNILFALFIFAVGFTSGPMFFRSLGKKSLKEVILSAVLAVSGLVTVVVLCRLFALDKGLAAGIAAGGLTQSAIMGTAESAINSMGLGAQETAQMVSNIAVGYGVTYIFGSFGTILVCVNLLQWFMGRTIRDDAVKAEANLHKGGLVLGEGEQLAVPHLTGRIFGAGSFAGKTVLDLEKSHKTNQPVTVERIKRGNALVPVTPDAKLESGDKILIIGQRSAILALRPDLGTGYADESGMELRIHTREIVMTREELAGKSLREIVNSTSPELRHGLYLVSVVRQGTALDVSLDTVVQRGDIFTLYGSEEDTKRAASRLGYPIVSSDKTDFVYMGFGLVLGILIGKIVVHAGSIPITLGSGGGALLSGLLFGWFRTRHLNMGSLPPGAAQLLKDLGLAGFVAVVGLNYGQQALTTIATHGISIFVVGALVTLIPIILTMLVGRYILHYDNVAVFAGALSGSRSANPAFGEVLNKAENSVPTVPFAVTYALDNVFLTLLGPLVVALV